MRQDRREDVISFLILGVKIFHTGYQIPVFRYQLEAYYVLCTLTAGILKSKDIKAKSALYLCGQ